MNKITFLKELEGKLAILPEEERKEAMLYYEEYLEEAGSKNIKKAIAQLGTPDSIAAEILQVAKEKKESMEVKNNWFSNLPTALKVLLIVFSPVLVPLAFALIIVVITLIFSLYVIVFALMISAFACVLSGTLTSFVSIYVLFQHFATGLFTLGGSIGVVGLGILIGLATYKITIGLNYLVKWIISKFTRGNK